MHWVKPRFKRPPHLRPEPTAKRLYDAIQAIELAREFEVELETWYKEKMEKEKKQKELENKKDYFWEKKYKTSQIFTFLLLIQPIEMFILIWLYRLFFG